MFHAFIKLFADILQAFTLYCHRNTATTWHFQTHLKLSGLQISVLSPGRARPTCQYAALNSSLTFLTRVNDSQQTPLKPLLLLFLPTL